MKIDREKVLLKMAKLMFTQTDLAGKAQISRQTLSSVMNGRSCRPELLGKIAKALQLEPEEIIKSEN